MSDGLSEGAHICFDGGGSLGREGLRIAGHSAVCAASNRSEDCDEQGALRSTHDAKPYHKYSVELNRSPQRLEPNNHTDEEGHDLSCPYCRSGGQSERKASMTLMRAARAAGSADATIAAASRISAEANTGWALGMRTSRK